VNNKHAPATNSDRFPSRKSAADSGLAQSPMDLPEGERSEEGGFLFSQEKPAFFRGMPTSF